MYFHQLPEDQVGAPFVEFQQDGWQARLVMEVSSVCVESGAANLELDCQVVRVELGRNDQAKRADIHSCIDHVCVCVCVYCPHQPQ